MDLVEPSLNVVLHVRIHLDGSCGSRLRLGLPQMLLSEQELPIQVRDLDDVGIGHRDHPLLASAEAKHCIVLKKLATDCPCSDHEDLAVLDSFEQIFSYAPLNALVSRALALAFRRNPLLLRQVQNVLFRVKLCAIVVIELLDWGVLLCNCLYYFLGYYASQVGCDGRESVFRRDGEHIGQVADQVFLVFLKLFICGRYAPREVMGNQRSHLFLKLLAQA